MNQPMFVYTALALAEVRGESLERVGEAVSANFERVCLRGADASGYTG